jgi:hypothetical protein
VHSAFLEQEDGSWTQVKSVEEVLDHPGDLVVNEHEDEEEVNLQLLAGRVGRKYACRDHENVIFTDFPLLWLANDALKHSEKFGGPVLCHHCHPFDFEDVGKGKDKRNVGSVNANKLYLTADFPAKRWSGWVLERERRFPVPDRWTPGQLLSLYKLSHNPELAAQVDEARRKTKRRQQLAASRQPVRKHDFENLAYQCSNALGTGVTKSFRVEQCWTWLAAHDAAFGRKATNALALTVARKWCRDREQSKKWLRRYAFEATVQRTDERFAAVCRQGKK